MDNNQSMQLRAAALHSLDAGVMIMRPLSGSEDFEILYVNPAWERLTGYAADETLGRSPAMLNDRGLLPRLLQDARAAREHGRNMHSEVVIEHKSGASFRAAISLSSVSPLDRPGGPPGDATESDSFVAHLRDISQQQAVLNRMQRLETLSHLQREVATTELDLDARRQTVAEVAMDVTGADSAVVEEADGDEMVYCAVAGDAHEQKGLRLPIADSISGLAYRERASQLVRDTDEDSRVPLKEQARAVGFRSGILAPLIYRDRTYGVLKVVAREPDRFDEEQRLLLELASGVLAASLYNAFEYHHELERRGMLLDALPAYISYIDADHRYQEVNTVYEQRFGLTADEIRGKRVSDLLGAEGYRRLRPYLEAAVRGERVSYEMEIPFADGDSRTLFGDYVPDSDVSGEVRGLYAIVRDVTDVRLAQSDYLTGLVNRREFEEQARRLVAVAERYESDLSLIMVDIDRFKEINDRHGHLAGDAVLKGLAELFRDVLRKSDIAGRWGGDEFGVLLPQTDIARAQDLAGRLCRAVRDRQNHQPEGEERFPEVGELTVSAGVAALASGEALEDLLRRADDALYQAKREGRNRVQSAS